MSNTSDLPQQDVQSVPPSKKTVAKRLREFLSVQFPGCIGNIELNGLLIEVDVLDSFQAKLAKLKSVVAAKNLLLSEEIIEHAEKDRQIEEQEQVLHYCEEKLMRKGEHSLPESVDNWVKEAASFDKERELLRESVRLMTVEGCPIDECGGKGWYAITREGPNGEPIEQQIECQWCDERTKLLARAAELGVNP